MYVMRSNQTPTSTQIAPVPPNETQVTQAIQNEVNLPSYMPYTPEAYAQASNKKRVLFFHASWCPVCRALDKEFNDNITSIPEEIIIFKTDFDKETALKNKYGITYQYTFVQVDASGMQTAKWVAYEGNGLSALQENIQ